MPKRINPLAQYLIYLAGTLAAYGIYATTLVPKLESNASVAESKVGPRSGSSRSDRKKRFAHLFPVDGWEMGPCKVLETSQGTVLFKDYQPYDDGRVEVFPFTMIIQNDSQDPKKPLVPIVLRSSQKAVLQFERAFQLNGGDAGKIQNGLLAGQVSIYRPPSEDGADDFLKVLTSNVQLEKHKIYTVDDVEFEFGGNHGRGRNLSIELSHDTPLDAINTDFSKINGIKSLKLGFLQRMRIQPSSKGPMEHRMLSGRKSPIEIRCQGDFGFDFEKQEATFFDQVTVQQLDDSGQDLTCEQLQLIFDSAPKAGNQPLIMKSPKSLVENELHLRKIVATGSPVQLNAKNKNAVINTEYLEYDLDLNTIIARSKTESLFQIGTQEFRGSDIQYRVREDGAIGPLVAKGPGSMRRADNGKVFSAKWSKSLSIQPDTQQRKRVTLEGQSELTLDGETKISGDGLQVWLWEIPQAPNAPLINSPLATPDRSSWKYLPHELRSTGNVVIDSPKLSGNTKTLTARWPAPKSTFTPIQLETQRQYLNRVPYVQQDESDNRWAPQTNLTPITYRPVRTVDSVFQDRNIRPVGFNEQINEPASNDTHLHFSGHAVEVDFASHDRDARVSQLVIEGQVVVRETTPKPGSTPLEIKGEQLFLLPQADEMYRVNVAGNASIHGNGLKLTGPDIHLDQQANRVWVVGTGTMNVKQTLKEDHPEAQLPGDPAHKLHNTDDVFISWSGGMIFDGHKMYFEDEVSASGVQISEERRSQIRSLSAALSIMLETPIEFRNLKPNQESKFGKVEIQEMILVDQLTDQKRVFEKVASNEAQAIRSPVVFEKSDFDLQGNPIARQKMIVPHASINVLTGNVRASGPGTLMNWQTGKVDTRTGIFQQASTSAGKNNKKDGKSFLRINFDRLLVADGERNHVRIDGKVRTIYAPIDNFQQQFNPDNSTRPPGAIKLTCDQMEMAQWLQRGRAEKSNEMTAAGNARIEGDQFDATADRLNYSEIKDLFTLEGSTRTSAKLAYVDPTSQAHRNLTAGKILYRPSDGWTEIQKVQEASMSQQGSLFRDR